MKGALWLRKTKHLPQPPEQKEGSNKMYRVLIYHHDEVIEELKKTITLEEAEKNGEEKIKELNNDGHWWYKIKVD